MVKPIIVDMYNLALSKQALVFTCLQYKSFENTVGKGEIALNEQFLLFPQCFLPIGRTFSHFHQIWNCRLQILSVWKNLKFVVWERVNCHGLSSDRIKPWVWKDFLSLVLTEYSIPFPNGKIRLFKLKDLADDNFRFDENCRKYSRRIENVVGKGEIPCYKQFLLFQCFQKTCTVDM